MESLILLQTLSRMGSFFNSCLLVADLVLALLLLLELLIWFPQQIIAIAAFPRQLSCSGVIPLMGKTVQIHHSCNLVSFYRKPIRRSTTVIQQVILLHLLHFLLGIGIGQSKPQMTSYLRLQPKLVLS